MAGPFTLPLFQKFETERRVADGPGDAHAIARTGAVAAYYLFRKLVPEKRDGNDEPVGG